MWYYFINLFSSKLISELVRPNISFETCVGLNIVDYEMVQCWYWFWWNKHYYNSTKTDTRYTFFVQFGCWKQPYRYCLAKPFQTFMRPFLACLFQRKCRGIVIVIVVVVVQKLSCSPLLKKYLRYRHQTHYDRCSCRTRGIILKAVVLVLCPFFNFNF